MCGIVGLFAKSPEIEERARRAPRARCSSQMSSRGPDSAGVAVYRDPAPGGSSKLTLYSPTRRARGTRSRDELCEAFGELRRARGAREPRRLRRRGRRGRGRARGCARHRPELRVMSAGQRDRDLQGGRATRASSSSAFALERLRGDARARPHADGDREPGHDRGLAPVLDRPRPLPRPQRLALEPQPAARRACAARGSSSRPRTTPRSPPATSPGGCARARRSSRRSRAASTTSTASTPSPSAPPTASRCCATRSPASRRCSPRPTTGSRWPPSAGRSRCFPARPTRARGSPSRASSTPGRGRRV